MQLVRRVSKKQDLRFSPIFPFATRPPNSIISSATKAPTEAASVGVKKPMYMPPITRKNNKAIPQTPLRDANRSAQV